MSEKDGALFWASVFEKRRKDATEDARKVDDLVAKALRFYAASLNE